MTKTPAGTPREKPPTQIVIHAMSEFFGNNVYAPDYLVSIGLSCHFMVTPEGEVLECSDPEHWTAWHAKGHNEHTIGIELLVPGLNSYPEFLQVINSDEPWCTNSQFNAAIELTRKLMKKFRISSVVRHSDLDPGRKQDPGKAFPWDYFICVLAGD